MNANVKKENSNHNTGSLIIGYDFDDENKGVLIVGTKEPGYDAKIINAFQGEEAYELYQKLVTKKEATDECCDDANWLSVYTCPVCGWSDWDDFNICPNCGTEKNEEGAE